MRVCVLEAAEAQGVSKPDGTPPQDKDEDAHIRRCMGEYKPRRAKHPLRNTRVKPRAKCEHHPA